MAQPASAARLPQPVQTILGGLPFSGPHRMILMVIQVLLFVLLGCVRATGARRGSGEAKVLLQGRIVPCGSLQTSSFYEYDSRRIVQIDDLFFLNEIMFDPVRGEGREVLGSMAGGVVP